MTRSDIKYGTGICSYVITGRYVIVHFKVEMELEPEQKLNNFGSATLQGTHYYGLKIWVNMVEYNTRYGLNIWVDTNTLRICLSSYLLIPEADESLVAGPQTLRGHLSDGGRLADRTAVNHGLNKTQKITVTEYQYTYNPRWPGLQKINQTIQVFHTVTHRNKIFNRVSYHHFFLIIIYH